MSFIFHWRGARHFLHNRNFPDFARSSSVHISIPRFLQERFIPPPDFLLANHGISHFCKKPFEQDAPRLSHHAEFSTAYHGATSQSRTRRDSPTTPNSVPRTTRATSQSKTRRDSPTTPNSVPRISSKFPAGNSFHNLQILLIMLYFP